MKLQITKIKKYLKKVFRISAILFFSYIILIQNFYPVIAFNEPPAISLDGSSFNDLNEPSYKFNIGDIESIGTPVCGNEICEAGEDTSCPTDCSGCSLVTASRVFLAKVLAQDEAFRATLTQVMRRAREVNAPAFKTNFIKIKKKFKDSKIVKVRDNESGKEVTEIELTGKPAKYIEEIRIGRNKSTFYIKINKKAKSENLKGDIDKVGNKWIRLDVDCNISGGSSSSSSGETSSSSSSSGDGGSSGNGSSSSGGLGSACTTNDDCGTPCLRCQNNTCIDNSDSSDPSWVYCPICCDCLAGDNSEIIPLVRKVLSQSFLKANEAKKKSP